LVLPDGQGDTSMDHRPLAITDDRELLDDLLLVAAAAGVELVVARSAA
jgi:hypothetical protein